MKMRDDKIYLETLPSTNPPLVIIMPQETIPASEEQRMVIGFVSNKQSTKPIPHSSGLAEANRRAMVET
jgi:hypothetical protein